MTIFFGAKKSPQMDYDDFIAYGAVGAGKVAIFGVNSQPAKLNGVLLQMSCLTR